MSSQTVALSDDLLRGVRAIAEYTGEPERRIRHLIQAHDFPAFKRGGLLYSKKSLLDAYYGGDGARDEAQAA